MEGSGREVWGAQGQLLGMLGLAWVTARPQSPVQLTVPGAAITRCCAGAFGLGLGGWRGRDVEDMLPGQGGKADRAVEEATVRSQLWDPAELKLCSTQIGPGSSPRALLARCGTLGLHARLPAPISPTIRWG